MKETQVPAKFAKIINDRVQKRNDPVSINKQSSIPDSEKIALLDTAPWTQVDNVICVFVDMINSTQLSAEATLSKMAKAYRYFTGTAVRIFDAFDAQYIDIKGDGVFAMFNPDQPHTALAAAVTFKTFCKEHFTQELNSDFKVYNIEVGAHMGIDCGTVLIKKIGIRKKGQDNICNEVWAGKPVNMAAKLASEANSNEMLVSDRFFAKLSKSDPVTKTCHCNEKVSLWTSVDFSQKNKFDFNTAYLLASSWCVHCGAQFCDDIISLDS